MTDSQTHIVVTGLMGVGKSTTAEALAKRLGGWQVRDSDVDLERIFGINGAELTEQFGVDELHRLESAMLLGALGSTTPTVISAAAWVVEDARCREALRRCARVVFLHIPLSELRARIETGDHRRTIDYPAMQALAERRAPMFATVSDVSIEATLPTDEVIDVILNSEAFRDLT